MAIKSETKEVLYCDCCGRKSDIPLTKCPICGRECCYTCSSQLYDVWHMNICKKCVDNPTINPDFMLAWQEWGNKRKEYITEMIKRFGKKDNK